MKQNNANMLFKSLALCFLILGNLTFEVLCAPGAPAAPAAAVTVIEGEVDVPKTNACGAIKRHYKLGSTENFFQSLIVKSNLGTANYNFLFNSAESGAKILADKINATKTAIPPATNAADAFKVFTTQVDTTTKAVTELKNSVDVSATDLQTFMNDFKFEGGKFVLKTGNGSVISLDAIAEDLVVYLNVDLPKLKTEVGNIKNTANIGALEKALIDAQVKLEKAEEAKTVADAERTNAVVANNATAISTAETNITTAKNEITAAEKELKDAKDKAIKEAVKQATDAVLVKVNAAVVNKPTGTSSATTTLKTLLDALNTYHIKTEYEYTATGSPATAKVTYSIVDDTAASAITSTNDSKISATRLDIKAASIVNAKIYLSEKFIDTSKGLAKDVFVAISEQCASASASAAVTDANVHFKAILTKLKSGFEKTVEDALSKTVTEEQFNAAFKPFATESDVNVAEADIGERKIKLCWLSNVTDLGQQFNNYITWLETEKKLAKVVVADKAAAVEEFFKVLQNNLADYKKKLEKDLTSTEVKSENPDEGTGGKPQSPKGKGPEGKKGNGKELESNAQPKSETKMSTTKKVVIIGSSALLILLGFFGIVILVRNYFSTKETAAA